MNSESVRFKFERLTDPWHSLVDRLAIALTFEKAIFKGQSPGTNQERLTITISELLLQAQYKQNTMCHSAFGTAQPLMALHHTSAVKLVFVPT